MRDGCDVTGEPTLHKNRDLLRSDENQIPPVLRVFNISYFEAVEVVSSFIPSRCSCLAMVINHFEEAVILFAMETQINTFCTSEM